MVALIENTNQTGSNLSKHEMISLLNKKIERCLIYNKPIIVGVSNAAMECRNTIYPDDYEICEEDLYVNTGNFELHINLEETDVQYDNTETGFVFVYHNMETRLYFLS